MTAVLLEGRGSGQLLRLQAPLSFWGGVGVDGTIVDVHHPDRGRSISGTVLALAAGRGSSSSSSVLAELIRSGAGPSAILLESRDAIVVTGALIAAELYGLRTPVVLVPHTVQAALTGVVTVDTRHDPVVHGASSAHFREPEPTS